MISTHGKNEATDTACLVLTAFASREQAEPVIDALISEHLASCVQVHEVDSTYVWRGKVVRAKETVLAIRTMSDVYPALERLLRKLHPYELPEIIQVPIADGLTTYIEWIAGNTAQSRT